MIKMLFAATAALTISLASQTALAGPLPVDRMHEATPGAELVQYAYQSKGFRSCMRSKYGPRYFSRVSRAHRFHMSQACM
jgi:hypothetical protein